MKSLLRSLVLFAFCFALKAQATHSATLTWTDTVNPTGTTYNAWRLTGTCPSPGPSSTPPSGFTQINSAAITAMTYVDTTVAAGQTYCYVVTAVGTSGQSNPSNTAGATVPGAFPVSGLGISVK